jgi:hypothetical protein
VLKKWGVLDGIIVATYNLTAIKRKTGSRTFALLLLCTLACGGLTDKAVGPFF